MKAYKAEIIRTERTTAFVLAKSAEEAREIAEDIDLDDYWWEEDEPEVECVSGVDIEEHDHECFVAKDGEVLEHDEASEVIRKAHENRRCEHTLELFED